MSAAAHHTHTCFLSCECQAAGASSTGANSYVTGKGKMMGIMEKGSSRGEGLVTLRQLILDLTQPLCNAT